MSIVFRSESKKLNIIYIIQIIKSSNKFTKCKDSNKAVSRQGKVFVHTIQSNIICIPIIHNYIEQRKYKTDNY